ncbi:MAG: hypothetical protein V1796_07085 [Pseudomonadota bacterium]
MNSPAAIAAVPGFGPTLGLIRFLVPRAERYGLIDQPGAVAPQSFSHDHEWQNLLRLAPLAGPVGVGCG